MKKLIPLFLVILVHVTFSSETNDEPHTVWLTDIEKSMVLSEAQDKPILLLFSGSDWCRPCMKLRKEVLETPVFRAFAREHLILLQVDFPRRHDHQPDNQIAHNEKVAEKYNPNGDFPLVLLLNKKGDVLAKTGYRRGGAKMYIRHLQKLLEK